MNALSRQILRAMAPLGVLAFWSGLWMAVRRYPSEYDWRYMSISNLVYTDRNPNGYQWAWGGLMLCALGGLCWTTGLIRDARRDGIRRRPVAHWALGVGYVCMVCALLPQRILSVPKGHEILALSAFFSLCIGVVQLTFITAERHFQLRTTRSFRGTPQVYAGLVAGVALLPILMAVAAPMYVSYALPHLRWVGLEWRALNVPVYLSFTFWEWITSAVFSAYIVWLSLAARVT
jgi:hypothetical protein